MTKNQYIFIVLAVAGTVIFLGAPVTGYAATTAYFEIPTTTVAVGSALPVKLLVDSDEPLNAYSFDVRYPAAMLSFQGTNNASSLITVSRGNPTPSQSGDITVKGGSIASFTGTGGNVLELDFVPIASGTASISFASAFVYLANGKGTKVVPSVSSVTLSIFEASGTLPTSSAIFSGATSDVTPPEISYLAIIPDPFNSNQKLLSFAAYDAGSGIREADMQYRASFFWGDWQTVKNPVSLPNGAWEVRFRAIDNAGNMTQQTLYDWPAFWILAAETLGIVIIMVLLYLFLK